ncbi:ribonuclease MC-like [Herrania umbratica]|uniref:Ribonuclease MC-like n=1 Tax=Herrania umbratica TaxID=108875 RepID=A0A6J1BDD0_9ROSI|nr:ribonuclease MC-like [Herrania umbratica]
MNRQLLAVAVLATLLVSVMSDFDFYKLSLQWPPSVCYTGRRCIPDIPNKFTIHGLWPQHADDEPVRPYNEDTSCIGVTPMSSADAMNQLGLIQGELTEYWPNLLTRNDQRDDQGFWSHEWENHGMCSNYPHDPFGYFHRTVLLTKTYNPLEVIGIQPGDETHEVGTILEAVKQNLGAYPQIACNTRPRALDPLRIPQLWEIRFCFNRGDPPSVLRDCPKKLAGTCSEETNLIRFPPNPI